MTVTTATTRPRRRRLTRNQFGYAALLVAIFVPVTFLGLSAVAVDTSRWFVEVQKVQSAADAASLAGVVYMPGDPDAAKATALAEAAKNGYGSAVVKVEEGEKPTQLKVSVTGTVDNIFGRTIGTPTTTITRSAVADYQGGLSMGSPCNMFGDDPEATSATKSANCTGTEAFWANVGSLAANKSSGDAFQNGTCSTEDGCQSNKNVDYDAEGYFYTLTSSQAVSNLKLEVFDPALVHVGDQCEASELDNAKNITPANAAVPDPATRYNDADNNKYCTGDIRFGGTGEVTTSYTLRYRDEGSDPARPGTWPTVSCAGAKSYPGFRGNLATALDKSKSGYRADVAATFRRWVEMCTLPNVAAQTTYALQVKTNGVGTDAAGGHNRFALRAYSTSSTGAKDKVSIAAFNKMAIYANLDLATTKFFLTRVPSTAAGQTLEVKLFDIGDIGGGSATIQVVAPTESGVNFGNCRATGKYTGTLSDCKMTINSTFGGKWQTIYVPVPTNYSCTDASATGCWIKLYYDLALATQPADTTSWQSSLNGDPVRLIR